MWTIHGYGIHVGTPSFEISLRALPRQVVVTFTKFYTVTHATTASADYNYAPDWCAKYPPFAVPDSDTKNHLPFTQLGSIIKHPVSVPRNWNVETAFITIQAHISYPKQEKIKRKEG
jgi:hypothetical protein